MAKPRRALTFLAAGMAASFAFIWWRRPVATRPGAAHVEIARVTDDLDIVLKDERSIRLVGVKALSTGAASREPEAKLAGWIRDAAGETVSLRLLTPIADRWGRVAGDMFVGGQHLQSSMAQAGLAVARPDDLRGPCWQPSGQPKRRRGATMRGFGPPPTHSAGYRRR